MHNTKTVIILNLTKIKYSRLSIHSNLHCRNYRPDGRAGGDKLEYGSGHLGICFELKYRGFSELLETTKINIIRHQKIKKFELSSIFCYNS